MTKSIQAIRGMSDTFPEESPYWSFLEIACRSVVSAYHYREIRFPVVE
ncbi:histidine--tRNA ligase, partial [Coxiella burnetii]